ncbi:MAG: c-type cytochrome, partial [Azonexus sp.]|nr:c-type cytochrome [Azonexus sp.]
MRAWILAIGAFVASGMVQAQPALQERIKAVQADPAARKAAVEAGKKTAFFCANCHGEDGVSKTPEVPNLAGQNPGYLLEQIRKFAAG